MPIVSSAVPVGELPFTGVAPVVPPVVEVSAEDVTVQSHSEESPKSEESQSTQDQSPTVEELTVAQKWAAKLDAKRKQHANLAAEIERLEAQVRSAELLDSVTAGSIIAARVGRAETAKEVTATVLGIQTLESGDLRYKICYGEGFETETAIISSAQIVDIMNV